MEDLVMTSDLGVTLRSTVERSKPLLDALMADLEREANLIRQRDLDPRNLADQERLGEAQHYLVDALEKATEFAKTFDTMLRSYASSAEKKIDTEALKEQLAAAPLVGRVAPHSGNSQGIAQRVTEPVNEVKVQVSTAAHKGADATTEVVAAVGWAIAAGAVLYAVLMDEKRRQATKSMAKALGSGAISVAKEVNKSTRDRV